MIQKKLVYLYLVHYATVDPQKTMMAISCLQKDCFDDDPVIRGLSLRSLCSVRTQAPPARADALPMRVGRLRRRGSRRRRWCHGRG